MRASAALLALVLLVGCGDDGALKVSAASSLKAAFHEYDPRASYSFAGSDELAAQIRAGARPDVYAAANTQLPQDLYATGLVERPVVFARNRLVIAAPTNSSKVRSLADLAKPGVTIAAGSRTVPVGEYTRAVLARLPAAEEKRILANVRSNEPDVAGVVGKVAQGAVDAGFVYVTDVVGSKGRLRAIELPRRLEPDVSYAAAVVKGAPDAAREFVNGLRGGKGRAALRKAGFNVP